MVESFLNENYVEIMMEVAKVAREHHVGLEDIVLELDFMSDGENPGPATLGKFKLDTVERYTTGRRPAKPAWTNLPMDRILSDLQKRRHMASGSMLGIVRNADSSGSMFCTPEAGIWSNEALACFPLDEGENLERFKSTVKDADLKVVELQLLRYTLLKAGEMAGLDRQSTVDFYTQLQVRKQQNEQAEGGH